MQIFISVGINIIVLSIVLILFYIFIVSRLRERIEDEAIKKVKDDLAALVREFNRSALSNISLLENLTIRAKRILKEIEYREEIGRHSKKKNKTENINRDISYSQEISLRTNNNTNRHLHTVDDKVENNLKDVHSENAILNMYKLGMDNVSIARELNKSISEIDMILSMALLGDNNNSEDSL